MLRRNSSIFHSWLNNSLPEGHRFSSASPIELVVWTKYPSAWISMSSLLSLSPRNSTKSFTLLLTGRRLYLSSKKLNHVWLQSAITSPLFGPFNLMNGPFTQTTYVWDFKVEIKKGCFLFKHVSLILAVSSWSLTPVSIRYTYHLFVYSSWPPSAELNCNIASYCSSRSTVYKRK